MYFCQLLCFRPYAKAWPKLCHSSSSTENTINKTFAEHGPWHWQNGQKLKQVTTTTSSALAFPLVGVCGVCAYMHLCMRGCLEASVSQGTQPAAFTWVTRVSIPGTCPVWESRRSQWGPGLGAPALGLHPASEWGPAQREVSYSVNSGFCFLLLFSQWCSGQGQPHRRQAMCKHSPASSSDARHLSSLACIIMDLTSSVPIDTCDQSSTQQPSLKLPADETVSVLHLGNVDVWIPGNTGTAVLALALDPLIGTTQAMQEGLKVAM